jgi:two-component system, sensor histidine kinase LadS
LCQFLNVLMLDLLRQLSRGFLLACLFMGASLSAIADVHDHISKRAYWEDTSAQATLQHAQSQNFKSYEGVLSRGYTTAAVWIELQITPPANSKPHDTLILRIRPIYLDEITLFDPLDSSHKLRVVGDKTNFGDEEYKSLTHTFVIPAGDAPRKIWLRLKATSTSLMNVEAFTPQDMLASEYKLLISYSLVLSLIIVFLILVFINWLNYREYLYAAFVVRHAIYFVYTASFFGFHRYVLDGVIDATALDLIYNWFVIGATGFSLWFESRFLREYAPPQWAKWIINGLLAWSTYAAFLLVIGQTHQALKVNMMLNAVGIIVLLAVASIFIDDKKATTHNVSSLLKKKWVLAYYSTITALLMFSVLPYAGAVAGNEFSINGLVFYALCSGMVMTVLMQLRANQLRHANVQYQQDLLLSKQQTDLEKIRRQEQSQLLTMLMHELKTPLSVIDLAQQSTTDLEAKGYVARNVTIIKNILDRCLNADRIAVGKLNVDMQSMSIDDMMHALRDQHAADAYRIEININTGITTLCTDYQCLQIILNNLLDNALRYGDATQPVQLFVSDKCNALGIAGLAFTVANKTGIASWPDPDKVFHKYYRSTGAQSISGTGLGLFLVASVAKILDGTCTYAPDDTHVRFELWLPT